MTRDTIDFGIDLGTTNSSIAVLEKHGPRMLPNNEGAECTPSAVSLDSNGAVRVGSEAKNRLVGDPENSVSEFKLWMGTTQTKTFHRAKRTFSAEQLSAEVLKVLKDSAKEDLQAAVITVPAAFDQPQSEATRRAAQIAGINVSPLLQEPVAAALAYGFQSEQENVFWLVYDFGGGTFDSAVIHLRDGLIQVVNHGGDNDLGGKLIDWAIVDQIFVPHLLREYRLSDFRRGNHKWLGAFAKLKQEAERLKIALSQYESSDVGLDFVCIDEAGNPVSLMSSVTRSQVEPLIHPYFAKSVNICRRVLAEKKLRSADIEKILLVGGPTKTPYLRDLLRDKTDGLGVALEFGIDPLTVVARGAALFAGGQKVVRLKPTVAIGAYVLQIEYKPIGAETEPLVGGKVTSTQKRPLSGFSIRFTNTEARPPWNSGNIPLNDDGTFLVTLWAEKQHQNVFAIDLFDSAGRRCEVTPNELKYRVGVVPTDSPLSHNIGVAMANNEVDVFFAKGAPIPAKSDRHTHRTIVALKRDTPSNEIKIPFVEGDHDNADLNRKLGEFRISASEINRDVPLGSEVEIRLQIDSSRLLHGSIYFPLLDREFPLKIEQLARPRPDINELKKEFQLQRQKLAEAQQVPTAVDNVQTANKLGELARENTVALIAAQLDSGADEDVARNCENRLLDLKVAIREIENQAQLPKLLADAESEIEWATQTVGTHGTDGERLQFEELKRDVVNAMNGDAVTLEKKIGKLFQLRIRILMRTPEYWVGLKEYLAESRDAMTDQAQAQLWFNHADKAINANDLDALKSACTQLKSLLPAMDEFRGYGGTTLRIPNRG